MTTNNTISFSKMHGLGNDFMVIDATQTPFALTAAEIDALGDRKTGVGFDQLLVVEPAESHTIDFNYRIFNTDGSEVEHCGNGARCFAKFVKDKKLSAKKRLTVKVKKGIISTHYHSDDQIEVDMAQPIVKPQEVPFNSPSASYQQQYSLTIGEEKITASVLSMGNPHIVLFVKKLWTMDIEPLGKTIQQSGYFPESVNVNFVEIIDDSHIELRTYERGVGETDACGTGACASAFAYTENHSHAQCIHVRVRGGELNIRLDETRRLFMSGPARWVFDGELTI